MAYQKKKQALRDQKRRSLRGLVANTAGLTQEQVDYALQALLDNGLADNDVEVLPLGSRQCVIYWTGLEWDEITSPEDLEDMAARKYAANLKGSGSRKAKGITRGEASSLARELEDLGARVVSLGGGKYAVEVQSEHDYPVRITSAKQLAMVANRGKSSGGRATTKPEADAIARELRGDFEGVRVVKSGRGYAVEFLDDAGWPVRVTTLDQLRMVANRGKSSGGRATTRSEADAIAREIRGDFEGVRVVKSGRGYAVEFLDDAGWPVRVTTLDQLRMVANGMRPNFFGKKKAAVPVDTSSMSKELFVRHMTRDRDWREAYYGLQSDYAMRDARGEFDRLTKGQIERMVEQKLADAERRQRVARERAAAGMVPNSPSAAIKAEIIEGLTLGFWPDVAGVEYDEAALKVAKDFYNATTKLNRSMTLAKFYEALPSRRLPPSEFGYYIAMQANGEGVSYWDSYDGPDGVQLVLPDVEASGDEEELFFSWDPNRLKRLAWGG